MTVLEYIWIDAFNGLRSKSKTLSVKKLTKINISDIPVWNFDGSSTGQAISTSDSEVLLVPRKIYKDPFRTEYDFLVLCDCYDKNKNPIQSNNRYSANIIFDHENVVKNKIWYGIEQEYVMIDSSTNRLLGWSKTTNPEPQGNYYCGIGANKVFGRNIVDEHYVKCLYSGINISGVNAEVLLGQWEFQVGPCEGIDAGDQLWVARYILERVAEPHGVIISYDPKPVKDGDWNGSGCHINCSTEQMRNNNNTNNTDNRGLDHIYIAIDKLSKRHKEHIDKYGDNSIRLSGLHETSKIDTFTFGVSDRTASIRIPTETYNNGYGYFEDRRPASDIDPYLATSILAQTILL
jgi:glutamine synthetase